MQRKGGAVNGGGGGGASMPMAVNGAAAAQRERRSMLQGGPYGLSAAALQQQQQQQAYLSSAGGSATMSMSMGNLGMTMTMSDMESSIRSFTPAQPQVTQVDSSPAPFWRPTSILESQQQQQQQQQQYKQANGGGLDLEFNDFLGGGRDGSGAMNMAGHSHVSTVDDSGSADVNMNEVASTFQLPSSFSSLSSLSAPSSVAPLNMAHNSLMQGGQRQLGGPPSSTSTSPTSDASSTRSTSLTGGSSAARPAVPVVAATGVQDASDYSRFVDSTDEPDLSQHKIEQKNEKCQYHNCPNRARVSQAYGKFCNRHVIVAPCGFPGCRDKAILHSSMCDKHLAEGKDALHRILANRAQNVPVCRTFGCFKNDQGRGYCRGHEKLLMATGRLPKHINKRRLNSAYTMCSFPNCNKHSQRNHLCRTHGNIILKQADELVKQSTTGESFDDVLARLQKEIRRCTHPTCTKNSQRDRLCTVHYYEKYNLTREPGAPMRDPDGQLSSTDGGGESDVEPSSCNVEGCSLLAHSSRGLCKYHSGQITPGGLKTPSSNQAEESTHIPTAVRSHPQCSISGCTNEAPFASGLCSHHGNKTNQAIQITRMSLMSPASSSAGSTGTTVCTVASCMAKSLPGGSLCEHHMAQRRMYAGSDVAPVRPSIAETNYQTHGAAGAHFMPGASVSADPNAMFSALDRFGSGATGRMANLSVGTSMASTAESDARQALVTMTSNAKQSAGGSHMDSRGMYMSSGTCSNPICSKESYGREFCEACQNMFSPLVVSVGDNNGGGSYPFPSLSNNGQGMQPEPEGDAMWDTTSEAKSTVGMKSKDLCRVKECNSLVTRGGLCDNHFRSFQAGALSVDEITLKSREIREEKERASAAAAISAAAEIKNMSSPKIKKYFCKMDGCDKQAQKRGLCKRHFRMQDGDTLAAKHPHHMQSSFEDNNQFDQAMEHHQHQYCRFPACAESVNGTTLCPSHSKATFCWQAGCENLVESPQFCEYHSYRRECGFENCSFAANRDSSGCSNHAMERRCSHEHCEQFASMRNGRCRVHVDDCSQQPCALCDLYGLRERALFHSSGNNNNNDFVDERELTRQAVFSDGRMM